MIDWYMLWGERLWGFGKSRARCSGYVDCRVNVWRDALKSATDELEKKRGNEREVGSQRSLK